MSHLAYLSWMLERGGDLPSESSPRGWLGLSQSTQIAYTLFFIVKFFVNSTNTSISLSQTVHDKAIWGICKGMVHRFVPQVWGLVPLGHVNSPPTPYQAPGIVGRAYQPPSPNFPSRTEPTTAGITFSITNALWDYSVSPTLNIIMMFFFFFFFFGTK